VTRSPQASGSSALGRREKDKIKMEMTSTGQEQKALDPGLRRDDGHRVKMDFRFPANDERKE
jgi:hypothetical protein